jgi:class 3 adenylate cyclase/tetratricopeptide (TPR) repeat protein
MTVSPSSDLARVLPYLPIDRRLALARGEALPERTHGAALFADISGFTALADALVQALGPQRGAEELTRRLDGVYGVLIAEVDRYGGSVVGFSGDAVTCWFDGDDGRRVTATALAMQHAMAAVEAVPIPARGPVTLGLKVAVASGPAGRFVVGDPAIQLVDVLAGVLLDRLALAEQHAGTGEVVLDEETAAGLAGLVEVQAWRQDGSGRYAVLAGLTALVPPIPWPAYPPELLAESALAPWLLPAIYGRIRAGQAGFLADLRPAVALFVGFGGIEYETDPAAGRKLDAYIRWVQQTVARFDGAVIQVTIGDKGSYLYAAFGAPVAHEDDAPRAVAAALALATLPPELAFIGPPRIGVSRGRMRAGPYGGPTRRTYGVLGDEVNVAARLMQAADPGQILVTRRVADATRTRFGFVPLAPVRVKGKSEPLEVLALQREPPAAPAEHLAAPAESGAVLPLVGREAELASIARALEKAAGGTGQVVAVIGEAGVGKSRLVAEAIRLATMRGLAVHIGEAQSYGTSSVYLAWHAIWRTFFGVDPTAPPDCQIAQVEAELAEIDPILVTRLPLLGAALNLVIPDNDVTRSLGARERKEMLESVLVACVRARATSAPLVLVLEDCHWLDPLSAELVGQVAIAVADVPVLLVLASRPAELSAANRPLALDRAARLPHCTVARLDDFGAVDAARLIRLRLDWLGRGGDDLPAASVEQITARTGGNPFYIEELLSYLHDRQLDPRDPAVLERTDLPESLHSLILSRIDHLGEHQRVILKVASVIGRQFAVRWLWGVYPGLGEPATVRAELDVLRRLDITPLETPEPDLRYLFKHVITQEVAYESQPRGARATLHESLGHFLETTFQDRREQYLDLLAYHYGRSDNLDKQRQCFRAAGEHAARRYASAQAATYLTQALALTPETDLEGRYGLLMARMQVFRAQFARESIRADLDALDDMAARLGDAQCIDVLTHRAYYVMDVEADYPAAIEVAQRAVQLARSCGLDAQAARAYQVWGGAHFYQENYADAREPLEMALALAREAGLSDVEARTINLLGVLAGDYGDYPRARVLFEQALRAFRALRDPWSESMMLKDLGLIALYQWDFAAARECFEQASDLADATGNRRGQGSLPARLGDIAFYHGEYEAARELYERAWRLSREVSFRRYEVHALSHLGLIASLQGDHERALALGEEALAVARPAGQLRSEAYAHLALGHAYLGLGRLDEAAAAYRQSTSIRREIGQPHLAVESVAGSARVDLARGDLTAALAHVEEILASLQTRTLDGTSERFRIYLTCCEVLRAAGDPRLGRLLKRAGRELRAMAQTIEDEDARRSFLQNVPWHREIAALSGGQAG